MFVTLAVLGWLWGSPAPSYWGTLRPGPHPVGFTQLWVTDSTRRLPGGSKFGLTHRPVLLNIWYPARPARAAAMPYDDYFQGAIRVARAPGLRRYASELMAYQRATAWRELARAERDSTEPTLARRIEALFRNPAYARRDLPRAELNGNIIVYTSGAGSSMDDNVVLCEYYASLGFTVVGSAFPEEDNTTFNTNGSDRSRPRDIARMLMELPRQGFPVSHVTAIGHSAGAQALLWATADPSLPVDAVLSLDTTEDYSMLSDRSWSYFTDDLVRRRHDVKLPIMFVADREGLFELADSLVDSRRTLVTVPDLGHNDFISQGNISRQLHAGLPDADSSGQVAAETGYRALLEYALAWMAAVRAGEEPPATASPLAMTVIPPGTRFPALGSDPVGSARELRHLYAVADAGEFARRFGLARVADRHLASRSVLTMILVDGIRRGAPARAREVYRLLLAQDSTLEEIPAFMESRAKLFQRIGATEIAAEWRSLRLALIDATGD
ncbi:MAG TPA: hypothetical protein VG817_05215 [Gemmatimonadales bacterium]|nr:hypothetical protein [Gemmatimonadales bacterium]